MVAMRLLVVGGAGYIGSVVASQLLDAGHEVAVADNLCRGHRDAVPEGARFAARLRPLRREPRSRDPAPRRAGDPAVLVASSRRIRDELGWVPQKPELNAMVADAWDFVQQQHQYPDHDPDNARRRSG